MLLKTLALFVSLALGQQILGTHDASKCDDWDGTPDCCSDTFDAWCEDFYDYKMTSTSCGRGKYKFECICEYDNLCDDNWGSNSFDDDFFSDDEFNAEWEEEWGNAANDAAGAAATFLIVMIISPIIGCIICCVACCFCNKTCCFEQQQQPAVMMIPGDPGKPAPPQIPAEVL